MSRSDLAGHAQPHGDRAAFAARSGTEVARAARSRLIP